MPSLLILTRYDTQGASSRLRMLQYVPGLESRGWTVRVSSLLSNEYLNARYSGDQSLSGRLRLLSLILRAYLCRLWVLRSLRAYDIVWLEKELFPFLPSIFERILIKSETPYVVDFDDAVFHNYDINRRKIIRYSLSAKLKELIARSSAITAGNAYLSDYAREQGAQSIERIPTVIDLARYKVVPELPDDVLRVGWVGSPSTTQYLPIVFGALKRLAARRNVTLVTVGALPISLSGVRVEQLEWSLESEVEAIQGFHIGIMPLFHSPWEMGKCGYKLIQYMACGRPVIASPVGVNEEIVSRSVGRLAATEDEWLQAFEELASDPKLRRQLGAEARKVVEVSYSKQVIAPRLESLFRSHLGKMY